MEYRPRPIVTDHIELPPDVVELRERLAENCHDLWARARLAEGWRHGTVRDDGQKTHPCLVPYGCLPESEKEYDRRTAMETVRVIIALGYRITRAEPPPSFSRVGLATRGGSSES